MKKIFSIFASFILLQALFATEPNSPGDVVFVNTGLMNIHSGGTNGVALYVPFAMRHAGGDVDVIMNGQVNLGGNFYQDALTPVFKIDETTTTSTSYSTGIFRFVKNWNELRVIAPDELATTYDRGISYVAFPNIHIATNDTLALAAKAGIDALTLKRDSGFSGSLILQSDRFTNDVFDASLRITGSGSSTSLVDSGVVIVEREMSYYRSISGEDKLFGYASPFKNTQLSGYFAGNWVRRPIAENETGHTRFIFGNEQDGSGVILPSQYIYNPQESLKSAQAYLIRPRPAGFSYQDLRDQNGLSVTDAEVDAYDQSKFVFDGRVYVLPAYEEQLFADDTLFASPSITSTATTINWLIGNSYTAPIGTKQLIDAMSASPLKFSPYIWVYPAGSSTYQSYKITGTDNIIVEDLAEIPAMSIFMIRVLQGTDPGQFSITRDMQRHAKVTHSTSMQAPSAKRTVPANIYNQVLFRVTPQDNNLVYDLAAIGLRESAQTGSDSYDMSKVYSTADVFQLFTLSSTGTRLSANGMPLNTKEVKLYFKPVSYPTTFLIEAKYVESLNSAGLWLEDLKTLRIIDFTMQNSYSFVSEPGDSEGRFVVHFVAPGNTGVIDGELRSGILPYIVQDNLVVKNLFAEDLGAVVSIFDASGRIITTHTVDRYPTIEIPFGYLPGVYMLHLRGNRNVSVKFLNK